MKIWSWIPRRRRRFAALTAALGVAALVGAGLDGLGGRGVEATTVRAPAAAGPTPVANMPPPTVAAPAGASDREAFARAFTQGVARFRSGDAHGAAVSFEAARAIDPSEPVVYANLGFAYLELGRSVEARDLFLAAIDMAPARANSFFGLAEALEQLGARPEARGAMRAFLHLAPQDDPFRRKAMAAIWEWSDPPEAGGPSEPAPPPAPPPAAVDGSSRPISFYDSRLETLDGEPTDLSEFQGRWMVLNIWASWCGPCRAELPSLQRLSEMSAETGLTVVGVSMDKRREFTREFVRELGVDFPNLWDGAGDLTEALLSVRALPLTLVLSPEGEIALRHEGALDWAAPEVVASLIDVTAGATETADGGDLRPQESEAAQ